MKLTYVKVGIVRTKDKEHYATEWRIYATNSKRYVGTTYRFGAARRPSLWQYDAEVGLKVGGNEVQRSVKVGVHSGAEN